MAFHMCSDHSERLRARGRIDTHLREAQRPQVALERFGREVTRRLGQPVAWPAPLALFTRRAGYPLGLPEWRHQMQRAGSRSIPSATRWWPTGWRRAGGGR